MLFKYSSDSAAKIIASFASFAFFASATIPDIIVCPTAPAAILAETSPIPIFLIKSIFSSIFLGKKGKKAPLINIRNYL